MKNFNYSLLITVFFSVIIIAISGFGFIPEDKFKIKNDPAFKANPNALEAKYHVLYCKAGDFLKLGSGRGFLRKKGKGFLLLKYYNTDAGLTLHGWTYRTGTKGFSPDGPNIKLNVGVETDLMFKKDSYIGDIIISWPDCKIIRKAIGSGNLENIILEFTPGLENPAGQIGYTVTIKNLSTGEYLYTDNSKSNKISIRGRPIPPGGAEGLRD